MYEWKSTCSSVGLPKDNFSEMLKRELVLRLEISPSALLQHILVTQKNRLWGETVKHRIFPLGKQQPKRKGMFSKRPSYVYITWCSSLGGSLCNAVSGKDEWDILKTGKGQSSTKKCNSNHMATGFRYVQSSTVYWGKEAVQKGGLVLKYLNF